VIVQDDHFDTGSVELGAFISDPTDAPLFGLLIEPDPATAWRLPAGSVDRITTVRRSRLMPIP
jgi:mRNA interferase MazF